MTKVKEEVHKCYIHVYIIRGGKNKILFCFCWAQLRQHKKPIKLFRYGISREKLYPLKNCFKKRTKETTPKSHKIRLLWNIKGKRGP
jgi:hypothetical protein